MLLPISHAKMTTRRLPVVTVIIIALAVLLHGVASLGGNERESRAMSALLEAVALHNSHPSLGVCAPLKPFLGSAPALDLGRPAEEDPKDEAEAKASYEAACNDLAASVESITASRFGYVPARANVLGLFTYTFVHADWWHVLGNMWFLFLCGLALEDRWGRLPFAVFYVVSGVVAAGFHQLFTNDPTAALIGASGAVAAAMGAFVVLFARTKIRFAAFFAFRLITFEAAAYVMLPLWAAVELGYGLLASASGTAHWAHVGGFAFGAAVAMGFRVFGVDRRLDDAVERAAVLGSDPRVDEANAMIAKGEAKSAAAMLEGLALEKPNSIHVWEALRAAARASGDAALAERAATKVADLEARRESTSSRTARSSDTSPPAPLRGRRGVPAQDDAPASRHPSPVRERGGGEVSERVEGGETVSGHRQDVGAPPFFPTPDKKGDGPSQ